MKKPASQTLLNYSILSLAVSTGTTQYNQVCTPFLVMGVGGEIEPPTKFSK